MKVKVFTLAWQSGAEGFDDAQVQSFLEGRTLIDVSEHFFVHEKSPVLTLVLTYREGAVSSHAAATGRRDAAPDVRSDLDPDEQRRFDALRNWRNHFARRAGKPPYLILTNRQVADVARRQPTSRAQLAEVSGVGESRIEEFGDELLGVLEGVGRGVAAVEANGDQA